MGHIYSFPDSDVIMIREEKETNPTNTTQQKNATSFSLCLLSDEWREQFAEFLFILK